MATRYLPHAPIHTPELSLCDSDDSYSSGEDDACERDETDQLLRQAHHYVITEGGSDSPTIYMERIQRINICLLQEITRHSYDCDAKLYRRVKQKVDHVLREFEDAVEADPSVYDCEEISEYYTAAAEEALYRTGSSPVTPGAPPARRSTQPNTKDDVERTYLYGGPDNHPENWYKSAPASLPFPETVRMADWESLRITYDLATTGNVENTKPVTCIGVSFSDPALAHHDGLAQYESGSRFRLPAISPADMAKVNEIGTVDKLSEAVAALNQNDDTTKKDGKFKYAPRVFLERLDVGQQSTLQNRSLKANSLEDSPVDLTTVVDQVRSTMNTTPTKLQAISKGSSGSSDTSGTGSVPQATRTVLSRQQYASRSCPDEDATSQTIESDHSDALPTTTSTPLKNTSRTLVKIPKPSPSASSAAIRRIKAATEAYIRSSPLPQSPPARPETLQIQVATHVSIPKKQPRSRTRKNPAPEAPKPTNQPTTMKRKRPSTEAAEESEPETTEVQPLPPKRKYNTRHSGRYKSVQELRRADYCKSSMSTPTSATSAEPNPVATFLLPCTNPALTTTSGFPSSAASTPPVIKARAAGTRKRKTRPKRVFEERVSYERYRQIMDERKRCESEGEGVGRGCMRSGKVRGV